MKLWYNFCIIFSYIVFAKGIMWNLEPNTQKCLKEELQQNIPVTGEFEVSEAAGQTIDYIVSCGVITHAIFCLIYIYIYISF